MQLCSLQIKFIIVVKTNQKIYTYINNTRLISSVRNQGISKKSLKTSESRPIPAFSISEIYSISFNKFLLIAFDITYLCLTIVYMYMYRKKYIQTKILGYLLVRQA